MTSPRIVVLMIVYNEERYLDETLAAVLAQTMRDFALIVLDNGSTDRTHAILSQHADRDGRISIVRAPANMDWPAAMNAGMTIALAAARDAEWFLFAGGDDLMAPDYLEAILRAAAATNANCIYSPQQWIGHPEKGVRVFPSVAPPQMHRELQVPAWRAVTRGLWDAVGGEDQRIRIGSDWDWALRAAAAGYLRPHQLDRPYLSLRVRDDRPSLSDQVDWPTLHGHLLWQLENNYGIAAGW